MSEVSHLQDLIIEKVKNTEDTNLLDLIYKLLVSEGKD